jgi:NADP-dependent 3-hydroxy acid dehydrogenase YdfG
VDESEAKLSRSQTLEGSVAAITGAGRGIGRATAAALVEEGVRVAIGDIDVEAARETSSQLGDRTVALELDVTDPVSFSQFLDEAERILGPVDVLVNNAGIMPLGPFVDEGTAVAQRQIDINVNGVLHGMKLALPKMLSRRRGHIVNVASAAGKTGFPGAATYCATKHAVVGVSEAVRLELRRTPIALTVVMPAIVDTELTSGVARTRGVKVVEPEDVATAIIEALRRPRFEVYVPRSVGVITRVTGMLPRPAREAIVRALRADRVLADFDRAARAAYAERSLRAGPPQGDDHLPAEEVRGTEGDVLGGRSSHDPG